MRARAVPGSLCWAGAAWGGQGTAPLLHPLCRYSAPREAWEDEGLYRTAGKHMRFALGGSSARDTCPAPGQDRPQHWSSSEQPSPLPTALPDPCPGLGSLCPRAGDKMLSHQPCPPLSRVTVPSMEGHHKQSSVTPWGHRPQQRWLSLHQALPHTPGWTPPLTSRCPPLAPPSQATAPTGLPLSSARPQGHCPEPLASHRLRAAGGNSSPRQH